MFSEGLFLGQIFLPIFTIKYKILSIQGSTIQSENIAIAQIRIDHYVEYENLANDWFLERKMLIKIQVRMSTYDFLDY